MNAAEMKIQMLEKFISKWIYMINFHFLQITLLHNRINTETQPLMNLLHNGHILIEEYMKRQALVQIVLDTQYVSSYLHLIFSYDGGLCGETQPILYK